MGEGELHETIPLTAEELESLQRIAMVVERTAIPAAHLEKLLDGGYVRHRTLELVVTDLGRLQLEFQKARLEALK
jgi:hypothetical protein